MTQTDSTPAPTPASHAATEPQAPAAADSSTVLRAFHPEHGFLRSRGTSAVELALAALLALAVLLPGIWSYTLVDPWETHYAEVARRMLQDNDWVHTKWQNEGFRSKPVLTFWLIAGSMHLLGIGDGGGFSGEMTSTPLVMLAVRLPFVLFAVLGLVMLFWMLANLVSRRAAWLSMLVVGTTPFYLLVARQAITDMPMVACLMGAMACFAMAVHSGDEPLRRIRGRLNSYHIFLGALLLLVGGQIAYYAYYFATQPNLAPGVRFPVPHILLPGVMSAGLAVFVWPLLGPTRYQRQVYMYWFYAFVAVSVLAKGLPAIGLAGVICFFYILLTNSWRLLGRLEIPRGVLLCLLVVVPWHFAMYLKDGRVFLRDYFITHLWRRAAVGVHGERGTFNFFMSQIGIGMWPWVGLLPAAVAGVLSHVTGTTREGRVRLIIGIWAVVGVAFFSAVQTKFHHYILPAVPALGVLVALWLDDLLAGRVGRIQVVAVAAAAIVLLLARDLMDEHKQLIELFIYRYDRPWPSAEPWSLDLSDTFLGFGLAFAAAMLLLAFHKLRRLAVGALGTLALACACWLASVYMHHAATHWGMREAIQTYYRMRQIHGLDIRYHGARQLADEWDGAQGTYLIESVIPEHLAPGQPMTIDIEIVDHAGRPEDSVSLTGSVARIGHDRFWVDIPAEERARLNPLIARGRSLPRSRARPWKQVDADRLIAWQLYWRGENFWSGDEIWGATKETQTAFKETDNKAFLEYLKTQGKEDRRYFLITESGRADNLRHILPTQTAKDSYDILDTSSNKFTLLWFTL